MFMTLRLTKKRLLPRKPMTGAVTLGCLLLAPVSAWSGYKRFLPKFVEFDAAVAVKALYEEDQADKSTRKDLTIQEGLGVQGYGYIYSPLFISMATSLGFGFQQVREEHNGEDDRENSYLTSFKQEFKVLPNHPYNAELYFSRKTPLTSGQAGLGGSTIIYEQGALFRYLQRPWSTTLTLINHDNDSPDSGSEYQTLLYNLHYFTMGTNANGSYSYNDSSTDGGGDTTSETYSLGFSREIDRFLFSGGWGKQEQDEQNTSEEQGVFRSYQLGEGFNAELSIDLPANFASHLAYAWAEKESITSAASFYNKISTESDRYSLLLRHRLFKSLATSIRASHQVINSTSGESITDDYSGDVNYSKKIPWGTFLLALRKARSYVDNNGAPVTLFENHTLDTTGPGQGHIALTYQTIDSETMTARLIDQDNNEQVVLVENIDYTLEPYNNSYRIVLISWPPINDITLDGNPADYNYQLSYAFIPADYELRIDNWGTSMEMALFNKLITPYYAYSQGDQSVLAGIYPGEPNQSKTHGYGVAFLKKPFSGDIKQSHLRSTTLSEDRLTISAAYSKGITPFTSGSLNLSYEEADSTEHEQDQAIRSISLTEQFYNAQAQLITVIPDKNLNSNLAVNYSHYLGVGKSTNWSFFTSLTWHVGLLDVDLSASYSESKATIAGLTTTRDHTTIKLMLKRELF